MTEPYDYGKRADNLADVMRRYLIGINTGGIAITLMFAANMASKGVHPGWVMWPACFFTLGLGISGGSLLYAKHKALKRKQAAENGKEIPKYDALLQRNFAYELITLFFFLLASGIAFSQLKSLEFEKPVAGQYESKFPDNRSNQ